MSTKCVVYDLMDHPVVAHIFLPAPGPVLPHIRCRHGLLVVLVQSSAAASTSAIALFPAPRSAIPIPPV